MATPERSPDLHGTNNSSDLTEPKLASRMIKTEKPSREHAQLLRPNDAAQMLVNSLNQHQPDLVRSKPALMNGKT